MSVADTEQRMSKPRKKRSVWRWLLWVFLLIFILIAIIATLLWVNRYAILEQTVEDLLREQGIEAELSIQSVSKTQAVLKNIRLMDSKAGSKDPFFSAQKITADYAWRDALKGRVKKLVFMNPLARVTLNDKGEIIDGWIPPQGEIDEGDVSLPPQGITIQDGNFTVLSPYGEATAHINAIYFAKDDFTAQLDIAPTRFSYGDWRMEGGGKVDVELKDENPRLDLDLRLSTLEHPVIDAADLHMRGNMVPVISGDHMKIDGDLAFEFGSLVTAQVISGAGEFNWNGTIERDLTRQYPLTMSGHWSSKVAKVVLPDPARRRDLANTLSLSDALLKSPIAQNFSGELTRIIASLLAQSDIAADGRVALTKQGLDVSLLSPARISSPQTNLILRQTDSAPIYRFSRAEQHLRFAFHAALTSPVGLTFNEAEMVAGTTNGWELKGVERFSANISTARTWRSKGLDGLPSRLAPFAAQVLYNGSSKNKKNAGRNIVLSGGIDYDGSVPGGYVTSLKTAGRMNMVLQRDVMSVKFKPAENKPILMTRFDTETEWRGEEITATLNSTKPIFRREGKISSMEARFSDVSLIAIDRTDTKNLGLTFAAMDLSGVLKGEAQRWDILGKTIKICSEDMPGPGTEITAPEARIQVERTGDNTPLQFYMAAPKANAKTQLVKATDIRIEVAGAPDEYVLHYSPGASDKGRVKFAGDAIPRLPMTGLVNYSDRTFEGTATTTFPLTDDTPINIAYRFKDGQGTADVDIPELKFSPEGLQPQYLVSALKGKIAEVEGLAEAKIKLAFAAGQPLQSLGTAKIINMNFGTLPGPLNGVNTEMSFSNMFPLQSQGRQTLTVDKFDPGFPLENGVIEFEMIPDGVKVYSARWPLGDGFFSLDPFEWLYSNEVNRVVMRIENVSIGEFLKDVGDGALKATGDIEGTLPIVLSGIDVKVENGELFVKDGGRIQYQSKQLESISELDGTDERAVKAIRQGNYRDAAFEALKDFRYDELRVEIDGPLDGEMGVFLKFDGSNKDVLGGQPFRFDVDLEGELLNILRSFNTNAQIKSELARRGLTKEEEPPDLEQ